MTSRSSSSSMYRDGSCQRLNDVTSAAMIDEVILACCMHVCHFSCILSTGVISVTVCGPVRVLDAASQLWWGLGFRIGWNLKLSVFIIMVALCNRAYHYIFALWFVSSFFSLPNLSSCRVNVYHTSTHGVALVRI